MKPLTRAVIETAAMGTAEVSVGVGVLSPLVRYHVPARELLLSAAVVAVVYGAVMWVLLYRNRWRAARDATESADGREREDPGRSWLRGTTIGLPVGILCGVIAAKTGNGGLAGIAVGNGVDLLILAGLIRRTERARGVELLRYPAFRRSGGHDFYVG